MEVEEVKGAKVNGGTILSEGHPSARLAGRSQKGLKEDLHSPRLLVHGGFRLQRLQNVLASYRTGDFEAQTGR